MFQQTPSQLKQVACGHVIWLKQWSLSEHKYAHAIHCHGNHCHCNHCHGNHWHCHDNQLTVRGMILSVNINNTVYTISQVIGELALMSRPSLGPRPKTNPSADCFQYCVHYTGSDIRAGWGLGTRLVKTSHVMEVASFPGSPRPQTKSWKKGESLVKFITWEMPRVGRPYIDVGERINSPTHYWQNKVAKALWLTEWDYTALHYITWQYSKLWWVYTD